MNFLFNLILFAVGLALGSFINVISLRYQPEKKLLSKKTIGGRSHCPYCRKELKWFELIPLISFLWQKGKCRSCGRLLFWQYPLVEFLSGLILVFVPIKILSTNYQLLTTNYQIFIAAIWVLIFLIFLLISIIDFRQYIIPDQLNILLAVLGLILIFFNQIAAYLKLFLTSQSFLGYYNSIFNFFSNFPAGGWINHIFAALVAMAFFGVIIILTKGKGMGWGDFKLAGALGLIFGWSDILMVVALAFVLGSIASVFLMLRKKKTMKDAVPFGPFLIAGAVSVFFFGFQLMNLYFRLFLG